jgi:hypothetical protein
MPFDESESASLAEQLAMLPPEGLDRVLSARWRSLFAEHCVIRIR